MADGTRVAWVPASGAGFLVGLIIVLVAAGAVPARKPAALAWFLGLTRSAGTRPGHRRVRGASAGGQS